jgi:hypothetical protein
MRSARTPEQIVLARVQQRVKLGNTKPSDEVQPLRLSVTWEPSQGVLAVNLPPSDLTLPRHELAMVGFTFSIICSLWLIRFFFRTLTTWTLNQCYAK